MLGRLIKEETGLALPIAIGVMVLVGVMGAGLLVFVRNDLEAVVEVNQGQNAFDTADAGVQVAKRHLAETDAEPENYDADDTNGDSEWSEINETGTGEKALDFDGDGSDDIFVSIRYLEPSSTEGQTEDEDYAPVALPADESAYPGGRNYFRVTARGEEGEAARQVRAILESNSAGIQAHYTPGNVDFKKEAAIDVSVFAGGDIEFGKNSVVGSGSEDALGDWDNPPFNTTPRKTSDGDPYTKAGLAAEGRICEGKCKKPGDSIADGVIAYDSTSGPGSGKGNEKKFVEKSPPTKQPQDPDTITYPFSGEVNVDDLLAEAKSGSPNIYEDISTKKYDLSDDSDKRVVFIDANGGTVTLDNDSTFRGALVVRCGELDFEKNVTVEGIVILLKGDGDSCSNTGKFDIDKKYTISGYMYAGSAEDDAMSLRKDATFNPLPPGYDEYLNLVYPSSVNLWSWRECYSRGCN